MPEDHKPTYKWWMVVLVVVFGFAAGVSVMDALAG